MLKCTIYFCDDNKMKLATVWPCDNANVCYILYAYLNFFYIYKNSMHTLMHVCVPFGSQRFILLPRLCTW